MDSTKPERQNSKIIDYIQMISPWGQAMFFCFMLPVWTYGATWWIVKNSATEGHPQILNAKSAGWNYVNGIPLPL